MQKVVAVLDAGRVADIGTAVEVAENEEQNADKPVNLHLSSAC